MSDRRFVLKREGLASAALEGVAEAERYAETRPMRCVVGVAALRKRPDPLAEQEDELVFGEAFDVLAEDGDFAFGQARRDGYVAWVERAALAPGVVTPTHWVRARSTFAFARADLKTPPVLRLSMNSLVRVVERDGRFARIEGSGWVFEDHLAEIAVHGTDPAGVARRFLGVPYLWGGRSCDGADCSGLVQQAHYACAMPSERDSDRKVDLGRPISPDELARGDLVFWKGHVGMMTDETTLLHANAYVMQTGEEPLAIVKERIEALGFGRPTGFRRP